MKIFVKLILWSIDFSCLYRNGYRSVEDFAAKTNSYSVFFIASVNCKNSYLWEQLLVPASVQKKILLWVSLVRKKAVFLFQINIVTMLYYFPSVFLLIDFFISTFFVWLQFVWLVLCGYIMLQIFMILISRPVHFWNLYWNKN